jgi:uncharacterized protein
MTLEQREDPFWNYGDLAVFLCLALPCLLLGLAIVKGILFLTHAHPGRAAELLLSQFLGYAFWFACLAMLFRSRYGRSLWSALSWRLPLGRIVPAFTIGVSLAFAVGILGALLRTPEMENTLVELMNTRTAILIVAFFATTLGPLSEELAFRGFLLPLLVRSLGAVGGIVMTALPFALLHGPQYHWSWQHLLLLTGVGCTFGWARYKTGSTGIPTIMHAGYNAALVGAFIISKRELF